MSPMMLVICENHIMKTPRNNGTIGLDKHLFTLTWQYGNFNDFRIILNILMGEYYISAKMKMSMILLETRKPNR